MTRSGRSRASAKQRKFPCGHRGPKLFDLDLFGEVLQSNGKSPDKCGDCFAAGVRGRSAAVLSAASHLARRGRGPLRPQQPVQDRVEHRSRLRIHRLPAHDCCPSGGFFAGHWTGQGFKPAFGDGATAVEQAIRTGQDVYVADGRRSRLPGAVAAVLVPAPLGPPPRPLTQPRVHSSTPRSGAFCYFSG